MSISVASISSDIDTLESIYQGRGCTRPGGYSYAEFDEGLDRFAGFLESFGARATLFMVGRDFLRPADHHIIRAQHAAGHEIANHTMTHAQGFRLLSSAEQEREVTAMQVACAAVTGERPVGFRSPGWNIDETGAQILKANQYMYDSSVFPTSVMPLLKVLHWRTTWDRQPAERTTLGRLRYAFAPRHPYQSDVAALGRKGATGLIELPVTVTPGLRLPFFATWLLVTGIQHFKKAYHRIRADGNWFQFQFHLSDFVEYGRDEYRNQLPSKRSGVYVPKALLTPLREKLELFKHAVSVIAEDYQFLPLCEVAQRFSSGQLDRAAAEG